MANRCPGSHGVSPDTHSDLGEQAVVERPFRACSEPVEGAA